MALYIEIEDVLLEDSALEMRFCDYMSGGKRVSVFEVAKRIKNLAAGKTLSLRLTSSAGSAFMPEDWHMALLPLLRQLLEQQAVSSVQLVTAKSEEQLRNPPSSMFRTAAEEANYREFMELVDSVDYI